MTILYGACAGHAG